MIKETDSVFETESVCPLKKSAFVAKNQIFSDMKAYRKVTK